MDARRKVKDNHNKFPWKYLIPGYGQYLFAKDVIGGTISAAKQFSPGNVANTLNENTNPIQDQYDDVIQVDVNPADPTSSASNVINYDPEKSASENMLDYATSNNSASAYDQFLQNKWSEEMSNSAYSRAIADAEANGISKYQLFQSGNMAASTPSSAGSSYRSYEDAMNRRSSMNEKELEMIKQIITTTISSAFSLFGRLAD